MLCDNCTEYRFPTCTKNTVKKTGKSRSTTSSSTSTICTRGKQLQRDATPALSVAEPVTVISNTASRSSSCSDTDTMRHCSKCNDTINNRHLVCDICLESIHPLCAGLTADVYETLMLIAKDTGWVCADCRVLCHNKMQHLQSSISRVHEEMCEMQKQMTGLKCELEDIKHAPTTLNSAHSLPATQPTDTEAVVSKVLHDAHRRRKNVIISGLPEAVGNCEADRRAADLTMFERLCEERRTLRCQTCYFTSWLQTTW